MPKQMGRVVWFNDSKGFGFIRPEGAADAKQDVFVHFTGIAGQSGRRSLLESQVVEYELAAGNKGPIAIQVRVVQP